MPSPASLYGNPIESRSERLDGKMLRYNGLAMIDKLTGFCASSRRIGAMRLKGKDKKFF